MEDGPPTTPPLNQPTWDGGLPPTHNNLTIIVDDDSDFADGKNKEYGVNAKGIDQNPQMFIIDFFSIVINRFFFSFIQCPYQYHSFRNM